MKILVIYFQKSIPLRNTIKNLECFEKYSNHDIFYYNSRFKFSNYLKKKNEFNNFSYDFFNHKIL